MIRHNLPLVTPEDIEAVSETMASGWIAQGPRVDAFEQEFNRSMGGGGSCACSSGTAALFLAFNSLGIGSGKKVAVPTYACSALLNAVYLAGAEPLVCDVEPDTFNLSPRTLPEVDCAVAVHAFGAPADITGISAKAGTVVEDCCQALGGFVGGLPLGTTGDAAVFSFYATKIISCGHGGLVWDKRGHVAEKARDYRNFDCREQYEPRFNFHMSDIQAAMVISQFSRLKEIAERRRCIAARYLEAVGDGVGVQAGLDDPGRMVYRFVLVFKSREARDAMSAYLAESGIQAAVPIERYELLHRYLGLDPEGFPVAERLVDTTLSLPVYPGLSDAEVDKVGRTLSRGLK